MGANNPAAIATPGGEIMSEVACEFGQPQTCDTDQPSFKAYFSRWMAVSTLLAPFTAKTFIPRLQASALGAAAQCTGQTSNICGRRWYQTTWDGFFGIGEQMSALSIFQNNLISLSDLATNNAFAPVSADTGGTSLSNPSAGGQDTPRTSMSEVLTRPITTGDRAGAGILTALSLILLIAATWWMVI